MAASPSSAGKFRCSEYTVRGLICCRFTLYDVQKILAHARMAERGLIAKDPVNESISLELDFINIFVRMVQILAMQQRRK